MRHLLIVLSLILISFTIISCGSDDGGSSATTTDDTTTDDTTTDDNSTSTENYLTCDTITTTDNDTTIPKFVSSSPADYEHSVPITTNISATFSETMDTSSVTNNTLDTVCGGTFQISLDGFTRCLQLNDPPEGSNSDKTFTITPKNNLLHSTVYRVSLTGRIKDCSGNTFGGWYMASGFKTQSR